MSQPIEPAFSKEEANERGLKYYFTGKECRHDHLSVRLAKNGNCYECSKAANRKANAKYQKANPEVIAAQMKRHHTKYAELYRAKSRVKYYQKQLDKALNELSDLQN